MQKSNKLSSLGLCGYAIGYVICVAISVSVLIITYLVPILWLFCYITIFVPFMFFSFMLNKKLITDTRLCNSIISFLYKLIATLLIWFIAFFPFSWFGITEIANIPAKNAEKQVVLQFQKEISNSETFTDLTPFGLGVYKLRNKGDKYLWDITKPEATAITYDGVKMVYDNLINRKDDETWDNTWGNSNKGKDVQYDVLFYKETYIIITPLWDKPGTLHYWGSIYLCKNLDKDSDLFEMGILDPKVVDKLRELPGQKLSRKELSEKLGKTM